MSKLQEILDKTFQYKKETISDDEYITPKEAKQLVKDLMLEILKASYKKGWFSDTVYQELCVEIEQL